MPRPELTQRFAKKVTRAQALRSVFQAGSLAALAILSTVPTATAGPENAVPIAVLQSDDGTATLLYDSSVPSDCGAPPADPTYHCSYGQFSVQYHLNRGETPSLDGAVGIEWSWHVKSYLYWTTDEASGLVGCWDNSHTNTGLDYTYWPKGGLKAGDGTVPLVNCHYTLDPAGKPTPVEEIPGGARLHWFFFGGFLAIKYTHGEPESLQKWGSDWLLDEAIAHGIALAACSFVFECGLVWEPAVAQVVGVGVHYVHEFLANRCGPEDICGEGFASILLNGEWTGGMTVALSLAYSCHPGGGHDTWNFVEQFLYNRGERDPDLLNEVPVGVPWPYDAGKFCVVAHSRNVLAIHATWRDDNDLLRRATLSQGALEGEVTWTHVATDAHNVAWTIHAASELLAPIVQAELSVEWDYEFAGEPLPRLMTVTDYQTEAGVHVVDEGLVNPFQVQDTAYVTLDGILNPKSPNNVGGPNPVGSLCAVAPCPPLFVSENPMVAVADATNLMTSVYDEAPTSVRVVFDLVPRIDCVVNCPGFEHHPLKKLISQLCPETEPADPSACAGEFLDHLPSPPCAHNACGDPGVLPEPVGPNPCDLIECDDPLPNPCEEISCHPCAPGCESPQGVAQFEDIPDACGMTNCEPCADGCEPPQPCTDGCAPPAGIVEFEDVPGACGLVDCAPCAQGCQPPEGGVLPEEFPGACDVVDCAPCGDDCSPPEWTAELEDLVPAIPGPCQVVDCSPCAQGCAPPKWIAEFEDLAPTGPDLCQVVDCSPCADGCSLPQGTGEFEDSPIPSHDPCQFLVNGCTPPPIGWQADAAAVPCPWSRCNGSRGESDGAQEEAFYFFFRTPNSLETERLVQRIRHEQGAHQKILVLFSPPDYDWAAYARANALAMLSSPAHGQALPGAPLITIVEQATS